MKSKEKGLAKAAKKRKALAAHIKRRKANKSKRHKRTHR